MESRQYANELGEILIAQAKKITEESDSEKRAAMSAAYTRICCHATVSMMMVGACGHSEALRNLVERSPSNKDASDTLSMLKVAVTNSTMQYVAGCLVDPTTSAAIEISQLIGDAMKTPNFDPSPN